MDDRELLELAAKAAGIKFHAYVDNEFFGSGINIGEIDVPLWNPLTGDGDALRLAEKLELTIFMDGSASCSAQYWLGVDRPTITE